MMNNRQKSREPLGIGAPHRVAIRQPPSSMVSSIAQLHVGWAVAKPYRFSYWTPISISIGVGKLLLAQAVDSELNEGARDARWLCARGSYEPSCCALRPCVALLSPTDNNVRGSQQRTCDDGCIISTYTIFTRNLAVCIDAYYIIIRHYTFLPPHITICYYITKIHCQ